MSKQTVAVLMMIVFIMVPFQYLKIKWEMRKRNEKSNPLSLGLTIPK